MCGTELSATSSCTHYYKKDIIMKKDSKSKGTWIHRFAIRLCTVILTILIFWVLGFFVDDIDSIPGPNRYDIEKKYVSSELLDRITALDVQIGEIAKRIQHQTERQRVIGDSSRSLQQTIGQLIELRKLSMEKSVKFSESEQTNFANSMNLFLENQNKYQELSQTVSAMMEQKEKLLQEKDQLEEEDKKQREPAREEYNQLFDQHCLKIAFLQLLVLVPILAIAATVLIKKRDSIYFPLYLAAGIASLLKVALVVHEYFPSRFFKYILIGGLLIAVGRLLVYFIRTIAFPKVQWLVKQYKEAYERFLCPVCEYPIRIGPRKFLFWTRRTVNKLVVPGESSCAEEAYICPSCGKQLFEECASCRKIRHSLLPNCLHCGAEKEIK